jgi:hypothetical protein
MALTSQDLSCGAGDGNRNRMTSLEVNGSCSDYRGELHFRESPSDHEYPLFTFLNGTLMARPRSVHIWSLAGRCYCGARCLWEKAATRLIVRKDHAVTLWCWHGRLPHTECYSGSLPRTTAPVRGTGGQRIRESGDTGDTF